MFKNRAVQIQMVNTKNNDTNEPNIDATTVDPEALAKIATEYTIKTVGAIGTVIIANKVLGTICDIAVIAAKAKFR